LDCIKQKQPQNIFTPLVATVSYEQHVHLSVCHTLIFESKQINLGSCYFHHWISRDSSFCRSNL